jgi:hypothetical protein
VNNKLIDRLSTRKTSANVQRVVFYGSSFAPVQCFTGKPKMQHKIILVICVTILAGAMLLHIRASELYLFGYKWPVQCFLHKTFGIKCALCGLTRSFCTLAHGNFPASIKFHLLGPAIFIFTCLQIPYRIYHIIIKPNRVNKVLTRLNVGLALLLVIAIFTNWFIYLGGLLYE